MIEKNTKKPNQTNQGMNKMSKVKADRRKLLLGLGAGATIAPIKWSQPIINSVLTPAHAQASVCPMIVISALPSEAVSGTPPQGEPNLCSLTFDVLSGDDLSPLSILDIQTSVLPEFVTLTFDGEDTFTGPVDASTVAGPRIVWNGPAVGAPFECLAIELPANNDITFSITATCAAGADVGTGEFVQEFTLAGIIAGA